MNSLVDIVNTSHAQKISLPTYGDQFGKKERVSKPPEWCGGFHIYGNTVDEISDHEAEQMKDREIAVKLRMPEPRAKKLKPRKLSPKAFNDEPSANQYADLHRKNGMQNVFVRKLLPPSRKKK